MINQIQLLRKFNKLRRSFKIRSLFNLPVHHETEKLLWVCMIRRNHCSSARLKVDCNYNCNDLQRISLVCLFIYLLTQVGFSGSYAADVGLRPTAGFLEFYRLLIYRPTRGWTAELAVGLRWMVSTSAWIEPATFYLKLRRV